MKSSSSRALAGALVFVLFGSVAVGALANPDRPSSATLSCPPGSRPVSIADELREMTGEAATDVDGVVCSTPPKVPEPPAEVMAAEAQRSTISTAPHGRVDNNALARAIRRADALSANVARVPGATGKWSPYGKGPLIANDPRFDEVNGAGFVHLQGRIDSLGHDPKTSRLFASIGTGGVWTSRNLGQSWKSIGDKLPTQIVGAVGWSKAKGGTLIVASGEPLMGGNTYTGLGAFYTSNLGKTWRRAKGVPNGAMGFKVAIHQAKQNIVYVATSKGLYRSTDAGRTYENVKLPTGPCAGKTDNGKCLLANFVTDVVVQAPDKFENKGGEVLAAVGYRAGARPYPQDPDTIESPKNGLYHSTTGKPGSFGKLEAPGFTPQERIGRVELGAAVGAEQNHDYVYAIVQDAVLFNGGLPTIDAPEDTPPPPVPSNTALNGLYVSADFGRTWTQMATTETLSENPTTGSALNGAGTALFNAPGIQAWYNEWISPDPTRQVNGIPTRLTFGLEEVWQNTDTRRPLIGPSDFKVIGRYYAYETCIIGVGGAPTCPPDNPAGVTTTHPDQHDAIWVSHGEGELSLVIGNDGGAYVQTIQEDLELNQLGWGDGANRGFRTLLPYGAAMAKDGTVWYGMQDNGSGKIEPDQKQYMTYGADGFYAAVDPDNSDIAYTESQGGGLRVTTDGGQTWTDIGTGDSGHMFGNPFVMDPLDPNHLMTGGYAVYERKQGPEGDWTNVFELGTEKNEVPRQLSAVALRGKNAYVGFCGVCDIISSAEPFRNGIATSVGGKWHIAPAKGLANRYITDLAIDPKNPKTVYVTLGGYANRQWRPPGSYGDANEQLGRGNVYRSTDGGRTFRSVSKGLPKAPAFTIIVRGKQLMIGTQIGAFLSKDKRGSAWAPVRRGLVRVPVNELQQAPQDKKLIVAATFGRGVYLYRFP
ncbi:MAG TPA: hypothetical protein VEU29_03740 [Actinomycetota bacterium]|nr:hypothetical protein [Actinomycetota bacterium]